MAEHPSVADESAVPESIVRALKIARRYLDMDVAYVATFDDGRQLFQGTDGDLAALRLERDAAPPLADTICAQMVNDDSLRVISDVAADPRVNELRTAAGIGSYIGVPLVLRDGTLYGSFCCVSRSPDRRLTSRDVMVLQALAEHVQDDIEAMKARSHAAQMIRRLLADSSITTALQPVVSLSDGACIGAEALSRFPVDAGPPDVVFAAARAAGVGLDLEWLAITRALAMLPVLASDQFLAVNMAPDVAVRLADWVTEEHDDVPIGRLVVEITEHAAVRSYEELRGALRPLRDRGLRLAIDDAGAGFASLHHVVELQPDIIKIDRSLIDGLARDAARRTVVSSFVLLGVELEALVIAEGLESEDDLAVARRLGVGAAQGYLFARPSTNPADHRRWAGQAHFAE